MISLSLNFRRARVLFTAASAAVFFVVASLASTLTANKDFSGGFSHARATFTVNATARTVTVSYSVAGGGSFTFGGGFQIGGTPGNASNQAQFAFGNSSGISVFTYATLGFPSGAGTLTTEVNAYTADPSNPASVEGTGTIDLTVSTPPNQYINLVIPANNTLVTVDYSVVDGSGNVVQTFAQLPGSGAITGSIDVTGSSGPYTVQYQSNVGPANDGSGTYTILPGGVGSGGSIGGTLPNPLPTSSNPTDPPTAVPLPATLPNIPAPSVNHITPWMPSPAAPAPGTGVVTVTNDFVTNPIFKQGVDKLFDQQDKRDTAAAADKQAWTDNEAGGGASILAAANAAGAANTAAFQSAINGTLPTATATASSPDASIFHITIAGQSVSIDPADNSQIQTGCDIIKLIVTAYLLWEYSFWVTKELRTFIAMLTPTNQAKGNTVAGTGGQLSAVLAAALISAVIIAGYTALGAILDNPIISWRHSTDLTSAFGSSSIGTGALYLLLKVFPVATLAAILTGGVFFRMTGLSVIMGIATAIRFIVPVLAIGLAIVTASHSQTARADTFIQNNSQVADINFYHANTNSSLGVVPANASMQVPSTALDHVDSTYTFFDNFYGSVTVIEIVDNENISIDQSVDSAGNPQWCIHTSFQNMVWLRLFAYGFSTGGVIEAAGLAYRLFYKVTGSREALDLAP